ncbi:MAG: zinc dependent phospholipase C family protein [Erysipelotrichaceae bacterium]|jgi:hypothetical protein|nr:zinc dependent phospholipase C family protein [Erysipelotrichaceae bacterium]MCI1327307.1 zinc dependent phospholipase C family protein [Solobacterium sp.]MCH4044674.1 zinc dependent phospholipase C family protein [Erysipelotrichaceae bacterium]MCH4121886.1 zinc dependent phospholipase C family protein [Erysipelotrichaceae bacterium]MCI1364097.1 zinc dependent phospholipase C family protein [Solobacterium sp.]
MPAATTHVEFAKDVFRALPEAQKQEITDMPMYYMGSQGPDMLFFSRFSILPGTLAPIGGKMHDEKIREVLSFFENYAHRDPALRSYYDGYLCHYALDQNEHPLINAYAHHESMRTGRTESEIHFRIEGEFDVYILSLKGRSWKDYDVYKYLQLPQEDAEKLALMYQSMIKNVFGIDLTVKQLMDDIRDVHRMTRYLKPSKFKYHLASYVESLIKAPKMVSGMMLSDDKKPTALNEAHEVWHPVYAPQEVHTESFMDLYEKAERDAVKWIISHTEADFCRNFVGEPIK